ncbi:MAG TPA: hypothetical protein VI299_22140 [Polyangiales bacterium]
MRIKGLSGKEFEVVAEDPANGRVWRQYEGERVSIPSWALTTAASADARLPTQTWAQNRTAALITEVVESTTQVLVLGDKRHGGGGLSLLAWYFSLRPPRHSLAVSSIPPLRVPMLVLLEENLDWYGPAIGVLQRLTIPVFHCENDRTRGDGSNAFLERDRVRVANEEWCAMVNDILRPRSQRRRADCRSFPETGGVIVCCGTSHVGGHSPTPHEHEPGLVRRIIASGLDVEGYAVTPDEEGELYIPENNSAQYDALPVVYLDSEYEV